MDGDLAVDAALIREIDADLDTYASFGIKRSGGQGDAHCAQWLQGRLRSAGYEVSRQDVTVPFFEAELCELHCGDLRVDVHAQPPIVQTAAGGLTAPLALLREPFEFSSARGAIAVLVLPYARHASIESPLIARQLNILREHAPAAIVLVTTGPTGDLIALNGPCRGSVATPPVVLMAPEDARPMLESAWRGLSATLHVSGRSEPRPTPNLHGSLDRGPARPWMVFSTPRTGWFDCVSERGTGMAAWLHVARWAAQRFPTLSIHVLCTGGHEFMFEGARRAMPLVPQPDSTALWVHFGASLAAFDRLEMRGGTHRLPSADPQRMSMATPSCIDAIRRAFAGLSGLERPFEVVRGNSELGEVTEHGYRHAFGVVGVPRMFHTRQDDRASTGGMLVAPVVRAHMKAIEEILA